MILFFAFLVNLTWADGSDAYQMLIEERSYQMKQNRNWQIIAAGGLGVSVGLTLSYLHQEASPVARVAYTATQVAGALLIGAGIRAAYSRDWLLLVDDHLGSIPKYKKEVVVFEEQQEQASRLSIALTAAVLSGILLNSAFQEEQGALRNVFLFLGAHSTLVSGYYFYRFFDSQAELPRISFRPYPEPSLEVTFVF